MTRKSDVLGLLQSELKKINKELETRVEVVPTPYRFKTKINRVERRFKYIDDINDFPTICFYVVNEARIHIGGGIRYTTLTVNIRAYVQSSMEDRLDAIDVADNVLEDIEVITNGFSNIAAAHNLNIEESRILRVSTDEGLFDPFGIADVTMEITYQQDTDV